MCVAGGNRSWAKLLGVFGVLSLGCWEVEIGVEVWGGGWGRVWGSDYGRSADFSPQGLQTEIWCAVVIAYEFREGKITKQFPVNCEETKLLAKAQQAPFNTFLRIHSYEESDLESLGRKHLAA